MEIEHVESVKQERDVIKKVTIGVLGGSGGGVFISDAVLDWIDETINKKRATI